MAVSVEAQVDDERPFGSEPLPPPRVNQAAEIRFRRLLYSCERLAGEVLNGIKQEKETNPEGSQTFRPDLAKLRAVSKHGQWGDGRHK